MAKKETKNNKEKNKKSFFKSFKAELKKVIWPTPKQLVNNTVAVVTIVLITAAIVFVLDFTFESINKHGIEKVKEIIVSNNNSEENTSSENETTEENAEDTTNTNSEQNNENVENNTENNAQ